MLKNIRENKGIPISFIARKTGLSRDTIRKIENGKTSIKLEWIPGIEKYYGVNRKDLINNYLKERGI